jgi:hypothetical protein
MADNRSAGEPAICRAIINCIRLRKRIKEDEERKKKKKRSKKNRKYLGRASYLCLSHDLSYLNRKMTFLDLFNKEPKIG